MIVLFGIYITDPLLPIYSWSSLMSPGSVGPSRAKPQWVLELHDIGSIPGLIFLTLMIMDGP